MKMDVDLSATSITDRIETLYKFHRTYRREVNSVLMNIYSNVNLNSLFNFIKEAMLATSEFYAFFRLLGKLEIVNENVWSFLEKSKIDCKLLLDFLMEVDNYLGKKNFEVSRVVLDLYVDPEDSSWRKIDVTFMVCTDNYDYLLDEWIKILKNRPKELEDVFIGVEPC